MKNRVRILGAAVWVGTVSLVVGVEVEGQVEIEEFDSELDAGEPVIVDHDVGHVDARSRDVGDEDLDSSGVVIVRDKEGWGRHAPVRRSSSESDLQDRAAQAALSRVDACVRELPDPRALELRIDYQITPGAPPQMRATRVETDLSVFVDEIILWRARSALEAGSLLRVGHLEREFETCVETIRLTEPNELKESCFSALYTMRVVGLHAADARWWAGRCGSSSEKARDSTER